MSGQHPKFTAASSMTIVYVNIYNSYRAVSAISTSVARCTWIAGQPARGRFFILITGNVRFSVMSTMIQPYYVFYLDYISTNYS